MPGLHARERKWTRVFAAIAGPLFLGGVWLGYVTLPKGLEILIGFNPDGVVNLVDFNDYLTFFSRTLLVFGIAFEIPLFVVLLNMAGVVSGKALGAHRPWIIVGTFVFAAIATPSADPFTMTFMAIPMVVLFLISEVIARINDRRRARRRLPSVLGTKPPRPRECSRPSYPRRSTPSTSPTGSGSAEVTWAAESGLRAGHHVTGCLYEPGEQRVACDLLAVDHAYPGAGGRRRHPTPHPPGLGTRPGPPRPPTSGRLTLLVPGTDFTADLVLDALGRLAKAVGASPDRYAVRLRIGD